MKNLKAKVPSLFGLQFHFTPPKKRHKVPVRNWTWKPFDPVGAGQIEKGRKSRTVAVETNYKPTKKRQNVVLILGSGPWVKDLIKSLRRNGTKYFCVNFNHFFSRGKLLLSTDPSISSFMNLDGRSVHLRDVRAVYWNPETSLRPDDPYYPTRPLAIRLIYDRWRQVHRDLRRVLDEDTVWLPSHPLNGSQWWQDKLGELASAARIGLDIPATIRTNDFREVKSFMSRYGGRVIFREFSIAGNYDGFQTAFVNPKELKAQNLKISPCVFQQYIEKEYEVRAVVVGNKLFACRINSQLSESAKIDWRISDHVNVSWEQTRLPRLIERRLLKLAKTLDLVWGSIDLIKAPDGKFYFLEMNRPGASHWLRSFVGIDISRELALYLHEITHRRRSP